MLPRFSFLASFLCFTFDGTDPNTRNTVVVVATIVMSMLFWSIISGDISFRDALLAKTETLKVLSRQAPFLATIRWAATSVRTTKLYVWTGIATNAHASSWAEIASVNNDRPPSYTETGHEEVT